MADVEIAVWLRWETCDHSAAMFAGCMIGCDNVADKV